AVAGGAGEPVEVVEVVEPVEPAPGAGATGAAGTTRAGGGQLPLRLGAADLRLGHVATGVLGGLGEVADLGVEGLLLGCRDRRATDELLERGGATCGQAEHVTRAGGAQGVRLSVEVGEQPGRGG